MQNNSAKIICMSNVVIESAPNKSEQINRFLMLLQAYKCLSHVFQFKIVFIFSAPKKRFEKRLISKILSSIVAFESIVHSIIL